ncbi:MAG: YceI family protein [Actinobacteria bacterium]|nr:YceI family protein [Actinomycetota bacterium]
MSVPDGSYPIGPPAGQLLVRTGRTGLGARAGHDLTIEVTRWNGTVTVSNANPAGSGVTVEVEAGSLEVREGTGGVKPLTDRDRAEIKRLISERLLQTGRFPVITFQSGRVTGDAGSFRIDGDLTIAGTTQPVTVNGRLADRHAQGRATVTQSRWGIKPYSGFFGALKLRDEVEVEFDIELAAAA